jgi:hypothetical protein
LKEDVMSKFYESARCYVVEISRTDCSYLEPHHTETDHYINITFSQGKWMLFEHFNTTTTTTL